MYKNVLQNIDHIAIWPVISFIIFFAFFVGLLLWVLTVDKKFIDRMKTLPMEDKITQPNPLTSTANNHV